MEAAEGAPPNAVFVGWDTEVGWDIEGDFADFESYQGMALAMPKKQKNLGL
jgi:hypothetical protein